MSVVGCFDEYLGLRCVYGILIVLMWFGCGWCLCVITLRDYFVLWFRFGFLVGLYVVGWFCFWLVCMLLIGCVDLFWVLLECCAVLLNWCFVCRLYLFLFSLLVLYFFWLFWIAVWLRMWGFYRLWIFVGVYDCLIVWLWFMLYFDWLFGVKVI